MRSALLLVLATALLPSLGCAACPPAKPGGPPLLPHTPTPPLATAPPTDVERCLQYVRDLKAAPPVADAVVPACVELWFDNRMAPDFHVDRVWVFLDGKSLFRWHARTDATAEPGRLPMYAGSLAPGTHRVQVLTEYVGRGRAHGYHFEVRSNHELSVQGGDQLALRVVAHEKPGPICKSPAVRYFEKRAPADGALASD
jgi:hypothetical protein